ncbi:sulfurtransferase-like selenium metabolism protein YedF [Helicobacter cholecystus]|uniref:Sulfurtransferase-like selenium metabolism protein YedF n=1 Tax=Helicobacter cholecystus TaxID=45498 RepID=A0A3D8IVR2_9HELI|nr:sulfurtransferase-like selenium metabolism protein YedF [Helicobacter cholecystus]RDU69090.1 sulfurtransferase-like selenium metabolism protein YedF [Helicobacter cholecystus]VEJ24622.1 putative selenium metabolism protein [Helicobacter cholecystus]
MREARIDVKKEICQDPANKVKSVLEQLREQNIQVAKIEIIGDCENALAEVENFLINQGYIFETSGNESEFSIVVKSKEEKKIEELEEKPIEIVDKAFYIKDDRLGDGELGRKLLDNLFAKLSLSYQVPKYILLLNRGVLLSQNDIAKYLQILERKGVEILLCKTCIDHFGIESKIVAGKISHSQEIAGVLMSELPIISL